MTQQVPPPAPSVGKLEKYVLAYANREGVAVTRVRHWISFMMLSGALARYKGDAQGPRFIVKGGVALELRLPGQARATDDLDIVAVCEDNDLVAALDAALREPYKDCTFGRRADARQLGDNAVRVWVQIAYRSQRWATIQVDLARPDVIDTEIERLPGIPLSVFGLTGPVAVECLSLRYHVAQKLHGLTKVPHHGGENDRFRDAIDLLLLKDLISPGELVAMRAACEATFRVRAQHVWPPQITLPAHWRGPLRAMAETVGLATTSLEDAQREIRSLLDAIIQAPRSVDP